MEEVQYGRPLQPERSRRKEWRDGWMNIGYCDDSTMEHRYADQGTQDGNEEEKRWR